MLYLLFLALVLSFVLSAKRFHYQKHFKKAAHSFIYYFFSSCWCHTLLPLGIYAFACHSSWHSLWLKMSVGCWCVLWPWTHLTKFVLCNECFLITPTQPQMAFFYLINFFPCFLFIFLLFLLIGPHCAIGNGAHLIIWNMGWATVYKSCSSLPRNTLLTWTKPEEALQLTCFWFAHF